MKQDITSSLPELARHTVSDDQISKRNRTYASPLNEN